MNTLSQRSPSRTVPAQRAQSPDSLVAAEAPAAPRPGSVERGGSPWLGRGLPPSPGFAYFDDIERRVSSWVPASELAVAPVTVAGAFMDWWLHLMASPAKCAELATMAAQEPLRAMQAAVSSEEPVHPLPQDKRFGDPAWHEAPYRWLEQAFLMQQQWWHRATTGVPGVSRHHEEMVAFGARQWLDMVSPSNFLTTNPAVQRRTVQEGGRNLVRGAVHAMEDAWRDALDKPPAGADGFVVGRDLAITPGRVVFRNALIELLQYAPATPSVHAEPVLIVPAWIMKYYVLDLSPQNSLIRHLVGQGFTVFAISWKNPDKQDRDLGFEDYDHLGVRAALDAIAAIVPRARVHAAGYCLGGTLLAMVAAALGRAGRSPFATVTLLAAQTDFTEPGELGLFVDEGQLAYLDKQMWRRGYLDKRQMKSTFQMMRSADLLWSYRVTHYLMGERAPVSDLMAWNADGTRMPYRMHLQYLRGLFIENALATGRWEVDGQAVNLADIRVPVFNVGAVQDHVAPWRSVFKLHALSDAPQTFVLTAGGHNVGVVNPPGQPQSSYRIREWRAGERLLTPDEWLAQASVSRGSWWTSWVDWLAAHSTARRVKPPALGAPKAGYPVLGDAPGTYVHMR